jgi:aminopeptidase
VTTAKTPDAFDAILQRYADVTISVGLNLRAGQRLMITGPRNTGGVSIDAAPLVRHLTASAYRANASLVEVTWGDETLLMHRFAYAPRDSFAQVSNWFSRALTEHVEAGHAVLSVYANDPILLRDQPADLVGVLQQATAKAFHPFAEQITKNNTNWAVIAAAAPSWAARVFPGGEAEGATRRLWQAIFQMCRLDQPDPVAAWRDHLALLEGRAAHLNARRYAALRYSGPGTRLTVGLPDGHRWEGGRSRSQNGTRFTPNLPTEEVFTLPHKDRVDGTVASSKPLSHGGVLIEDFSLTFEHGRVTAASAAKGEDALKRLLDTDHGARSLGEVALVPHSSPISRSGLLFYNTLFDENAASHLAIGTAYRFTLQGGQAMSDDAFAAAGGNQSRVHVDFMIGSGALDVDGIRADGSVEPVLRKGEWTQPSV